MPERLEEAPQVKPLIAYLLDHLILDFQTDLTLDQVREFLREDDSRESRALLAKLVEDGGVQDMLITLADCLQDYLKSGISEDVMREQVRTYAES
jgi:aminopeptidase C